MRKISFIVFLFLGAMAFTSCNNDEVFSGKTYNNQIEGCDPGKDGIFEYNSCVQWITFAEDGNATYLAMGDIVLEATYEVKRSTIKVFSAYNKEQLYEFKISNKDYLVETSTNAKWERQE